MQNLVFEWVFSKFPKICAKIGTNFSIHGKIGKICSEGNKIFEKNGKFSFNCLKIWSIGISEMIVSEYMNESLFLWESVIWMGCTSASASTKAHPYQTKVEYFTTQFSQ